jgi:hypothetical protein
MAEREILKALQIAGIVRSGVIPNDIDEMVRVELGAVFFPHGNTRYSTFRELRKQ